MPDRIPGPTANRRRALRLLTGAAIGGHLAALVCVVGFWLARGPASGLSAAIAAAVVLAFSIIGQAVQVLVADAPAKTVMVAALASYGGRVSVLGIVLMMALSNSARFVAMDPIAVVVTTIGVVIGWLGAEFRVYSHLRIPVYDEPHDERPTSPRER